MKCVISVQNVSNKHLIFIQIIKADFTNGIMQILHIYVCISIDFDYLSDSELTYSKTTMRMK